MWLTGTLIPVDRSGLGGELFPLLKPQNCDCVFQWDGSQSLRRTNVFGGAGRFLVHFLFQVG